MDNIVLAMSPIMHAGQLKRALLQCWVKVHVGRPPSRRPASPGGTFTVWQVLSERPLEVLFSLIFSTSAQNSFCPIIPQIIQVPHNAVSKYWNTLWPAAGSILQSNRWITGNFLWIFFFNRISTSTSLPCPAWCLQKKKVLLSSISDCVF